MTTPRHSRHRSDEARSVREPLDECHVCGRGMYHPDDIIRTATRAAVCEMCTDELIDGDCCECHAPVLLSQYADHLVLAHDWDNDDAEWEADAHEVAR